MANQGRPRRGGGGGGGRGRGPPRGMPRRPYRRPLPPREFQEVETLGSEEISCDTKTIVIEFNSNKQGQFMKISETEARVRARFFVGVESIPQLRNVLKDYVKEIDSFKSSGSENETERLRTETFNQGKRRYFIDIRQNSRGVFVKLTLDVLGSKSYVAFPLENLQDFYEKYCGLVDEHYSPRDDNSPSPTLAREVRAGGKTFYFDVEKNDRGTFVRLTEVIRASARRTHINIPNSCWPQMSEVFSQLAQELPYEDGSGTNSGSEDN